MNSSKMARYMMMQNGRTEHHDNRDMDMKFRDNRGRTHYDNGRYAPMKNEYMGNRYRGDDPMRSRNEGGGYIDYSHDDQYMDKYGDEDEDDRRIIGFASVAKQHEAKNGAAPMTREMADEWMTRIRNEDGTKGAHWSLEEVKRVMHQKGIECDPIKLWVAVNAEYSDRYAINKKYGVDKLDFYIDSAIAYWLKDQDAVKDKLSAYYTHVVKH